MWVERPDGTDVTADYYGIGSLGTRYFYYFDDAFRSSEVGKKSHWISVPTPTVWFRALGDTGGPNLQSDP